MAAQETAHMPLSMPLTGCTYSFVTVALDNSRKVVIDNENQSDEVLKTGNSRCQGLSHYTIYLSANLLITDFSLFGYLHFD